MQENGFEVSKQEHPIVPIMIGDATLAKKMASELLKKGSVVNQVRPIKYITLAVDVPKRKCWYVVPPNDLVIMAAGKRGRGQHTEIPF